MNLKFTIIASTCTAKTIVAIIATLYNTVVIYLMHTCAADLDWACQ